jgi:hypothetical protein
VVLPKSTEIKKKKEPLKTLSVFSAFLTLLSHEMTVKSMNLAERKKLSVKKGKFPLTTGCLTDSVPFFS